MACVTSPGVTALPPDQNAELVGVRPVAVRLVSDPGPPHQACALADAESPRGAVRCAVLRAISSAVLAALTEGLFVIGSSDDRRSA